MAEYTPNYNFYLPAEGDSRSNGRPWAQAINNNFIDLDSRLKLHSDGLGGILNNQGAPNGYATLDSNAKLKIVQLPSIGSDNISGLDASKISGQLIDLQIAALAASKITGQLISSQLGNSIIDQTKMAAGLRVPVVVNILPTLPDTAYPQGSIVTLSTNNKLYRSTGTAWTAEVPAVDISGQLSDAQIAAIAAAKLTGQITSTQITDGSISTPKLAAGSVTTAVLAANAVTAANIAANTITAAQIAANTITASQIAANTITSSQIAADSITAASIAAGAITSSELAAGAVIAGKIAASSIGATEIIAGSITTSLLNFTPVQSTNVVASINASAEGIRISGSKITIDGTVSFTAGYDPTTKIASGGAATDINNNTTTINGGKITTGTITASQIASNTITATQIAANTITASQIAANTITASQLSTDLAIVNVIRSTNYVAGTSIAAPVGLKLSGTAFTTTFLDGTTDTACQFELGGSANLAGFKTIGVVARSMSAIGDNGASGTSFRTWYRGSNDSATNGGRPSMSGVTVTPTLWYTASAIGRLSITIQPSSYTDNLDGMRYAKIEFFTQSALGTTATLNGPSIFYLPLCDRGYANPTLDTDTLNAINATYDFSLISASGYPACKITLYNAAGSSDTHCYYSDTGWAAGVALVDAGTSWPAGITGASGGGTGTGTGGGGACPAPDVFLLMADGTYKLAGDIRVGDMLVAWDEESRSFVKEFVIFASPDTNDRWSISLSNGKSGKFAHNHRFLLESGEWKELENLVPGEILFGGITVLSTEPDEVGQVVKITVNRVHTYITLGVISHNVKPIT